MLSKVRIRRRGGTDPLKNESGTTIGSSIYSIFDESRRSVNSGNGSYMMCEATTSNPQAESSKSTWHTRLLCSSAAKTLDGSASGEIRLSQTMRGKGGQTFSGPVRLLRVFQAHNKVADSDDVVMQEQGISIVDTLGPAIAIPLSPTVIHTDQTNHTVD